MGEDNQEIHSGPAVDPRSDRSQRIPVETSIKYLGSEGTSGFMRREFTIFRLSIVNNEFVMLQLTNRYMEMILFGNIIGEILRVNLHLV